MNGLRSRVESYWAPLRARSGAAAFERLDSFLAVLSGEASPERPQTGQGYGPCRLQLPGLPPNPWCDATAVDGVEYLVSMWTEVRDEAMALYRDRKNLVQVATKDEQDGWFQYFL